jgi:hypothetical protein
MFSRDVALGCALAIAAFASIPEASAHSWYSNKKDPIFKQSCCGGSDCGMLVINSRVLTAEADGYHIRLTLEETRKINPYSVAPIDAVVSWDRIQLSEDGNYHICLMTGHRDNVRGGIYCLFAPPNI